MFFIKLVAGVPGTPFAVQFRVALWRFEIEAGGGVRAETYQVLDSTVLDRMATC